MALTNDELKDGFQQVLRKCLLIEGRGTDSPKIGHTPNLYDDLIALANEHAGKKQYWYKLTPALIDVLKLLLDHVAEKGENRFSIKEVRRKMLSEQYTQTSKLRFHGLIAKVKDDNDTWTGEWLLTRRTGEFMRGDSQIPEKVLVQNNKVIAHDDVYVSVVEAYGSMPYIERWPEFFEQSHAQAEEDAQLSLM